MKKIIQDIILVLIIFATFNLLFAESDIRKKKRKLAKTNGQPEYTFFNINNISTWVRNNGETDINRNGNSGLVYPIGSSKACIFQSGLIYGGKVNGQIRVGGSTFNQGQVPGRILENGKAENPNLDQVRIYRVRRDYKKSNLSDDLRNLFGNKLFDSKEDLIKQFESDWKEWPARFGAPYEDVNSDGFYDPNIDIPGIPGADMTVWYVANDKDEEQARSLYGSPSIGIEMQVTFWGYNANNPLKNTIFRKYILINKSTDIIKDTYITMWVDPDVGDATDDFVGCDTLLNLGYAFNATNNDATYNDTPPAVGFRLLKGPIVKSINEIGVLNGTKRIGYKNLNMTSFSFFIGSDPVWSDPGLQSYEDGTLEAYNLMQGLSGPSGKPFIDPTNNLQTKFALSGDPISKKGWFDGIIHPPGDRRIMMNSGPFEMAPGDTQEVIYAQIVAGAYDGIDNLEAVKLLKEYSKYINDIYNYLPTQNSKNVIAKGTEFNNKVLLKWGDYSKNNVEENLSKSIKFQGYNIYQLPSQNAEREDFIRIATFDIKDGIKEIIEYNMPYNNPLSTSEIKFYGTDSGIERFLKIKKDFAKNTALKNGTPYYYLVSSYYLSKPNSKFNYTKEYFSDLIKVLPSTSNPGVKYNSDIGDKIESLQIRGSGKADVDIIVVDPTEVNGSEYEISFNRNNENKLEWSLFNIDSNKTVLTNQKNISGTDDYLIVEGIRIKIKEDTNQPLTEEDTFRFSTPSVTYNIEQAKIDIEEIKTFPNPYYGFNSLETSKFYNYIMINHLPQKATIRVFNLAGQLVRTLRKNSPDQYYIWDLQNEKRIPVASGFFIIHIVMPELGKTKILKQAVILNQVIPDFY